MAIHDKVAKLRSERLELHGAPVPQTFQGVSKARIAKVLKRLHLKTDDMVDGVFALLDNETNNWFTRAPKGAKFSDGATTAHLACHIGILQRGEWKLDREGRDYWIKPLTELAAIEPILLHEGEFIIGHVKANSPNSSYRLSEQFRAILLAPDETWPGMLTAWAREDAARERREFQAAAAAASRLLVDGGHGDLIKASIELYAKKFLDGYEVLFIDEGNGDRITDEDRARLAKAGITLERGDAMPDVLLWHPGKHRLWVIEAVTSDGEVDIHKVQKVTELARRCGITGGVGFTTTYRTWREAAARQGAHQNIAVDSYMWIQTDPAKHFLAQSFDQDL